MNNDLKHPLPNREPSKTNTSGLPAADLLLFAIILTPLLLIVLTAVLYAFWGSGPVILVIPWFTPMFSTFVALTSFSVVFLALGRYLVLRDSISYWIGLTFAGFGIGLIFYVLAWPGLLPDDRSFIASLSNTAAWISSLSITLPAPMLLAAAMLRWPTGKSLRGRRAKASMAAWILFIALLYWLVIIFERSLPILVRDDGTYTPTLHIWNAAIVLLQIVGVVLSTRRYRISRDRLIGYVAFFQLAFVFTPLLILAGGQRYDLWWYLSRIVLVSGCLIVLCGLFLEYVHLFGRVRDSEARYRQLTESLPQLIWTSDADGQFNYLSPQWEAYTGIQQKSQLGFGWLQQVHEDDRQHTLERWLEASAKGIKFDTEYRIRRYDGTFHWFKVLALPIQDANSKIFHWFGSCTDIEDQKQIEADLREFSYRLERSNRDLQDFAHVASHDLQEPLRKIETFGDAVMEESASLTGQQTEYLKRMRTSASRMRSMINGLLQLSRLEIHAQPFQPVDLGQIADDVIADLEIQIRQSEGVVEVDELPLIDADPQQMRQLFQNLIGNALKFKTPEGKPRIRIFSLPQNSMTVQIHFEDNGIGFDNNYAGHLFEPFKRLVGRSEYEGSGMGLAICRKIIERHNGNIIAIGKPGQGSIFIVTLPIQQERLKAILDEVTHG
jgi:PAS domain S-box-containing protein